jgi:hypothetical protein
MKTCCERMINMTSLEMESELEECDFGLEHAWRSMEVWVDRYMYHLDA